jgi:DNA helicase-2/ATP-dependent DNA helicase PcrA
MEAILRDLTEPQREAVTHIQGPLLILAGPGSGKTRVVTHRIAYMLSQGVSPQQIVALTFTNKAADEMRSRLERLAPTQPVWMGTFHRFCARLLRRYASLVGLQENYSIFDSDDAKRALRRAIQVADVSTSHTSPEQLAQAIGRFKNRLILPEMLTDQQLRPVEHVAARVYPHYQQQLLMANAVDFDDLLMHVARLLRDNPELRSDLDSRNRFILVDEYQDTNLAQYAIVRAMSVDHPNLSVTGDPDQSIYGWRGADIRNMLDFERDFPDVKTVRLEENYRSTPEILHVADTLIRFNSRRKAKELFTHNPSGVPVGLKMYFDGDQEADDIALQVLSGTAEGSLRPRDVAVFCRVNSMTRSLEHAFRARGIPYQIVRGLEFYQRKEIKDLLAYLHLINNPSHNVAFERVINTPPRGIGDKTLKTLRQYADKRGVPMLEAARAAGIIPGLSSRAAVKVATFVALYDRLALHAVGSLADLLNLLVVESDYIKYLEKSAPEEGDNYPVANVKELISEATNFDHQHPEGAALEAYLERVALVSDTDAWEDSSDRVSIMTLHASKGLEFPHVYIIAVEDNILPHERSKETERGVEEERRLLFVGITRAEKSLQISYCRRRSLQGKLKLASPSHFLMELPREAMRVAQRSDPAAILSQAIDDEYSQVAPDEQWERPVESSDELCQLPDDERASVGKNDRVQDVIANFRVQTAATLLQDNAANSSAVNYFRLGMFVVHPQYGRGQIVDIQGKGLNRTAKVEFGEMPPRSFRLAYCPLTPEV